MRTPTGISLLETFEFAEDRRVSGEELSNDTRADITLRIPMPKFKGKSLYLSTTIVNTVIDYQRLTSLNLTTQITASKKEWEDMLYANQEHGSDVKRRRTMNSSLYVMTKGSGPNG
jgi:Neuraminidase (sialidase)